VLLGFGQMVGKNGWQKWLAKMMVGQFAVS